MTGPSSPSAGTSPGLGTRLVFGEFSFDPEGLLLFRAGEQVSLPPKAAGVLGVLLERPGQVVGKQELMDLVWGAGALVADRSLSEAVGIVRQALEDDPHESAYVQTVHRRGYRFVARVAMQEAPAAGAVPTAGAFQGLLQRHGRPLLLGAVGVMVLVAALAFLSADRGGDRARISPVARRLTVSLPQDAPLEWRRGVPFAQALAISPDGSRIVYVSRSAEQDGSTRLFQKRMDRFGATPIPGTEGAAVPFFSPDGQWVGFLSDGVYKVRVDGGTPVRLADARVRWGATWGGDFIYYVQAASSGIYRVPAEGGEAEQVTTLDRSRNEEDHVWPQLLPDGETLLFVVLAESDDPADARIETLSLRTGERKTLLRGSEFGRYLPSGHLVYLRDGSLWARTFDSERLELGDKEVRLLETDPVGQKISAGRFAVADNGTLVAAARETFGHLVTIGRDGDTARLPVGDRFCRMPAYSPDGGRIALACSAGGQSDIWVLDVRRGTMDRLTSQGASLTPVWTPDGGRIAYGLREGDSWRIEWKASDGQAPAEEILTSGYPVFPQSWSPDGHWLVFLELDAETGEDIWEVSVTDGTRRPLVVTPTDESGPRLSPDGRWLAYHSVESGEWHVYLRRPDRPDSKLQLSPLAGGWPVWSRDGSEVFLYSGAFYAVHTGGGANLAPGKAELLFEPRDKILADRKGAVFDVSPDGRRLVATEYGERPATRLYVILDWGRELPELQAGR